MPAPRVPTNILKLRGADKKNPARMKERENEPVPKAALGNPPRHLNAEERKCWRELVRTAPFGVLADCDGWEVEIASCLMAQYRADRAGMPASRLGLLHSVLSKFGFNPSDRSRVQVPPTKEKNPFDDDF
jgi:phage terminase small subunit